MNTLIVETFNEDGSEWGVSFTNHNPELKDYIACKSYKDAEKLQEKLKYVVCGMACSNEEPYGFANR